MNEIETQAANDFCETAQRFCELIAGSGALELAELLNRAQSLLPTLYAKALALPAVEGSDEVPLRSITHEQWSEVFGTLQEKIGEHDGYWIIYDPTLAEPDEPVFSSLADDLADIWRDLKNGLLRWESDEPLAHEDAVWEWQFNFEMHWSHHAAEALSVLTWLLHQHKIGGGAPDSARKEA